MLKYLQNPVIQSTVLAVVFTLYYLPAMFLEGTPVFICKLIGVLINLVVLIWNLREQSYHSSTTGTV